MNPHLYLAVGFSNEIAILSENGNYLTTLLKFDDSLFLKKMTFH